jgi:hypothetical protein
MPGKPAAKDVKMRLNRLVERRNAMVHEGDYERLDRPQRGRLLEMSPSEARESVKFLSDLINAIHEVTSQ